MSYCSRLWLVFILVAAPFVINCQFINYTIKGDREKTISETIDLSVSIDKQTIKDGKESGTLAAIAGSTVPIIVDLGTNLIKQEMSKSSKRFTGEFTAKVSEQGFYQDKEKVNLPAFTITREFTLKKDGSTKEACQIILIPELAQDKTAFRYKLSGIKYDWSKAKTKKSFDKIDVNVSVSLQYLHSDGKTFEVKKLRDINMMFPGVSLDGKTYSIEAPKDKPWFDTRSEWIPFPAAPKLKSKGKTTTTIKNTNTESKKENEETEKTSKTETVVETKKEEDNFTSIYDNSVLYEVSVTVKEVNPYKVRADEKKEYFEGLPFDGDGAMLGSLIQLLLSKEEESADEGEK